MDLRANVRRIRIELRPYMTCVLSSSTTTRASSLPLPLTVTGNHILTTSQQSCRMRLTCCFMNAWDIPEFTVPRLKTGSSSNKLLQLDFTARTPTHRFDGYGKC